MVLFNTRLVSIWSLRKNTAQYGWTLTALWLSYGYNTTVPTTALRLQFDCLQLSYNYYTTPVRPSYDYYTTQVRLQFDCSWLSYNYYTTPVRLSYDYYTTQVRLQFDCSWLSYNYYTTPARLSYDYLRLLFGCVTTLLRLQYDCIAIALSRARPIKIKCGFYSCQCA